MAIKFKNALTYGYGFNITAKGPVDSRTVVDSIADLTSVWGADAPAYVGMVVAVVEDGNLYTLIADDASNIDNWKQVGSGAGSISVENFTFTEDDDPKIVEAEKIGQIIYVTGGTEAYPAGPYIVTGVGVVAKLGTTTATGDIAGDVETLKGNVSTLQSDVDAVEGRATAVEGRLDTAEGEIDTLQSEVEGLKTADATLQSNIDAEASAREAADNALSGRLDTAEADIDTLEGKVAALASATHFLGVKDSLDQVEAPAVGDIVIVGNKEYVYDDTKGWVELGDTTAESSRISDLESTVGNADLGLVKDVADNKAAIEAVEGRATAVEGRVDAVEGRLDTAEGEIDALQEADEALKGRLDVLEAVEHPTKDQVETLEGTVTTLGNDLTTLTGRVDAVEGRATAVEGRLDTAESEIDALQVTIGELTIKSADTTASHGVALKVAEGVVGVEVDIDSLAAEVIAKHEVKADQVKLGSNIGTAEYPDRYTTNDTVQGVLGKLNERIESIDADIQAALEGGVTGIEMGNGISVDNTTPTKPKVSVKVVEGSALVSTADGLDLTWSTF